MPTDRDFLALQRRVEALEAALLSNRGRGTMKKDVELLREMDKVEETKKKIKKVRPTIQVDFNSRNPSGDVSLNTRGALNSIFGQGLKLRGGDRIRITDDEIECVATVMEINHTLWARPDNEPECLEKAKDCRFFNEDFGRCSEIGTPVPDDCPGGCTMFEYRSPPVPSEGVHTHIEFPNDLHIGPTHAPKELSVMTPDGALLPAVLRDVAATKVHEGGRWVAEFCPAEGPVKRWVEIEKAAKTLMACHDGGGSKTDEILGWNQLRKALEANDGSE